MNIEGLKDNVEQIFHDQWLNPKGDCGIINCLYHCLLGGGMSGAEIAAIELKAMGRAIASLEELGIDASHIHRNLPKMQQRANGR